jgi:PAS domain S-box-containing protein
VHQRITDGTVTGKAFGGETRGINPRHLGAALTALRDPEKGGGVGPGICLAVGGLALVIALISGASSVTALVISVLTLGSALLAAWPLQRKVSSQSAGAETSFAQEVIEHAHDAFVSMDRSGKISTWNAQAESIFGWSRHQALGYDLADLIVPSEHREAHRAGLRRCLETGNGPILNKRVQITAMHRIGRQFPVEMAIWPVKDERGAAVFFNAFIHDISARRQIDQDRAELAESLRALLATSGEGIIEVGRSGRCTFMNASAGHFLGLDPADMVGQDACALIYRDADDPIHDHQTCVICDVFHNKQPARREGDRFWRLDGTSFAADCRTHPTFVRGEVQGAVIVFTPQGSKGMPADVSKLRLPIGDPDLIVGVADTSDHMAAEPLSDKAGLKATGGIGPRSRRRPAQVKGGS